MFSIVAAVIINILVYLSFLLKYFKVVSSLHDSLTLKYFRKFS